MATTGSIAKIETAPVGASPTYTVVPAVGDASWSMSRPSLEVTAIGDKDASFLSGVMTVTASANLFFDNDEAQHNALLDNINDASAPFLLRITLETGEHLTGQAFVTSYEISTAAGDLTRAALQFQVTGAVTIVTTP